MKNEHSSEMLPVNGENRRRSFWSRIAPALGLFFLAPLVGEYLLGNISIKEPGALPLLSLMYGGGALLIREAVRRTGRGWPTILLLALAYGVAEPALFDHSLFNASFEGHDFRDATYLPALGISVSNALAFCVGHAVWSISVPIAIVEMLVPDRRTTPWLGRIGLAVTGVLYLLGGAIVFLWAVNSQRFLPSVPQFAVSIAVVLGLIGAAFAVRRLPRGASDRPGPNPWLIGVTAFFASSLFFLLGGNWLHVAVKIGLIAVMAIAVARWSGRAGWGTRHRFALTGGTLLTYVWGGFVCATFVGNTGPIDRIGIVIFSLGAIVLLMLAARKIRRIESQESV
ncbi:hypothetical protein Elgi_27060 [Paenibacillus elgii]|uniref:hypothetical protein n=1 Tax=Paenibacillus elgii TaxID=189691 RepID=UPI002D7CEC4E|nr:hypothetical protein Elgi_27060 [Paenibacillus elgii]